MRRVDSGSACSERLVELTMSAKRTVTVLRTSPAEAVAPDRGVAQLEQNFARSEFSSPQFGHSITRAVYEGSLARLLLHRPVVSIRVGEEEEAVPRASATIGPDAILHVLDLTDLDAASDELAMRGFDVRNHQLQAALQTGANRHGAAGPRRRELDDAEVVADPAVDVHVE